MEGSWRGRGVSFKGGLRFCVFPKSALVYSVVYVSKMDDGDVDIDDDGRGDVVGIECHVLFRIDKRGGGFFRGPYGERDYILIRYRDPMNLVENPS